jgi:hypothetical protein
MKIPYYPHHIVDRSLLSSQESSPLVATALMGNGGHVSRKEPEGPEIMEAYEDSFHLFE